MIPGDLPADQRRRARMVRDALPTTTDPRVRAAMAAIPRHAFVPDDLRVRAYEDAAFPLAPYDAEPGPGQSATDSARRSGWATISQPRVVAAMLSALALKPGDRVLDVGAGSGYVTALLAHLVAPHGSVLGLERLPSLAAAAERALENCAPLWSERSPDLRTNRSDRTHRTVNVPIDAEANSGAGPRIRYRTADGLRGSPVDAPFTAIHIACACGEAPPDLLAQLATPGRMIFPLQLKNSEDQRLILIQRDPNGMQTTTDMDDVQFVPAIIESKEPREAAC